MKHFYVVLFLSIPFLNKAASTSADTTEDPRSAAFRVMRLEEREMPGSVRTIDLGNGVIINPSHIVQISSKPNHADAYKPAADRTLNLTLRFTNKEVIHFFTVKEADYPAFITALFGRASQKLSVPARMPPS